MSVYMTEEEQLEAIKKWWHKYSTLITIVLSLLLLSLSGYKYWHWHKEKVITEASNAYEHLMIAFSNQDDKNVKTYANQLIKEYSNTVYAHAARLTLAKLYVAKENFNKASQLLDYVANHCPVKPLKDVARIRIARVYTAQKSYDKALAELGKVDDLAYIPIVNELKGDIYTETGQYQQAINFYKKAISEVRTQGMGNLYLEMKTNELAALAQTIDNHVSKTV
ncbi:YfgM family protein [Legionella gresilensis]|uniref:YfgM family protein n=1 Tax=Legionella gresilensis TaxID=91823 RepID=UPI0010418620|nr:tetratricopeptide repeat protein [Legionella gresilensis]